MLRKHMFSIYSEGTGRLEGRFPGQGLLFLLVRVRFAAAAFGSFRRAFQTAEVFVQSGAEFFGKGGAGFADSLGDAAVFAGLFLVGADAHEGQGRINRVTAAAVAGG